MLEEKVSIHVFDTIVTNKDGFIISFQTYGRQELQAYLSNHLYIQDVFDNWSEKGDNIVFASKNESNFLLLYKDTLQSGETFRVYIITNGKELFELDAQVKQLDKTNQELDAIIESSYDGIYITDKYGNTLNTNSAIERITGIPKHYYIGKNINHLIQRGILQESVTLSVMEQKKTVSVVQKNFHQKETLLTGSPIFNEDGEVEKIVTNIRDLSELNQLNEELQKAQLLNEEYQKEIHRLKNTEFVDPDVIVKSEHMIEIYKMVERIANFDTTILFLGETGVGKDVLVRHLYKNCSRSEKGQLVKINCGAIPKELMESELFGYEGGAFSGANRTGKVGMFELAHNGILFLDEIGELSLELQVKLLRAIQEKEFIRVGGTKTKWVNVRLVAATNRDLKGMVKSGQFREDLYYRLNVVPVHIPPLRERKDDILPLVFYYLDAFNKKYKMEKSLHKDLSNFFYYFSWPGNVRELSNLIERLILTVDHRHLKISDLPDEYKPSEIASIQKDAISLKDIVESAEKEALKRALAECKTTYELAEKLKTSQATIVRKLKKYHL